MSKNPMVSITVEGRGVLVTDHELALRQEALEVGYKDQVCPTCNTVLLAHHHFLRCDHGDCPMRSGKSLLQMSISEGK
jgi:ribosomal protein S27AE